MSNYVKYTAADGTVHLCHEDSPMLMHAKKAKSIGAGGRAAEMAWNAFMTTYGNLIKFLNKNKIGIYGKNTSDPPYNHQFIINCKDSKGKEYGDILGEITIHFNRADEPLLFVDGPNWRDRVDRDVFAMNDIMRVMKEKLNKYKLTSEGYYVLK